MRIILFLWAIFFLPTTLVAQNPIISAERGWQLQEMPILQPSPALIQQNYLYSSRCIGGSFPDQGYWLYCEASDQDKYSAEGKKKNWLGLEGCDASQVYYPSLDNQIPLAGLRNCQLLVAKINPASDANKQMALLQLLDKEGRIIWSYDHSILLEKLIPEGDIYPTVPYRDLMVENQAGYLLFDGEYVAQVDIQGKSIWKTPISEIIQGDSKQFPKVEVTSERYRPRILSNKQGSIYVTVPIVVDSEIYPKMFVYQIGPQQQKFHPVFNSSVFEKNDRSLNAETQRSWSYEPLILGNGELAIVFSGDSSLGFSLGLLKFNSLVKDWRIWWQQERSDYQEILSTIQTPISQVILAHVSPVHSFEDYYDDPEGIKSVSQVTMDYTIRLINIADDGGFEGESTFLLERNLTITASTTQPIGYLAYMPLEGLRVMMNVAPDYWRDWQFFKLKQVIPSE